MCTPRLSVYFQLLFGLLNLSWTKTQAGTESERETGSANRLVVVLVLSGCLPVFACHALVCFSFPSAFNFFLLGTVVVLLFLGSFSVLLFSIFMLAYVLYILLVTFYQFTLTTSSYIFRWYGRCSCYPLLQPFTVPRPCLLFPSITFHWH